MSTPKAAPRGKGKTSESVVDEPSVMTEASASITSTASSIVDYISTSAVVKASTSTVLSWWDQSGIECVVASCDHRMPREVFTRNPPSTSSCESSLVLPDDVGESDYKEEQLPRFPHENEQPRLLDVNRSRSISSASQDETMNRERTHSSLPTIPETQIPSSSLLEQNPDAAIQPDAVKYKSATSFLTDKTSDGSTDASSSCSSSSCPPTPTEAAETKHRGKTSFVDLWEHFVKRNGDFIADLLTALARNAAKNPYTWIVVLSLISVALPIAGVFTNFTVVVDNGDLWPPRGSFSVMQSEWLYDHTFFTYDYRNIDIVVHAEGGNVLTNEGISRVFQAMNVVQEKEDYIEGCKWADLVGDSYRVGECHIHSVSNFWNNSQSAFETESYPNWYIQKILSADKYPSGETVDLERVIGRAEKDSDGTLTSAKSFLIEFDLPWSYETGDFEWDALEALLDTQKRWEEEEGNPFRLEVVAYRSYEDEFLRAIFLDLPLIPAVFLVVALFCCLVFWRYDMVQSRSLLGLGAVVTIVLSVMTSFGVMFICGVPFTTSTIMLPFLMFGVGLDDSFIIMGSYNRTSGTNILKRIDWAMKDISVSISITTLTSALAFALGCFSNIPSVRWLCIYACPAILIDFFYQCTFFIALLVLDEKRIQENRRDCCVCIQAIQKDTEDKDLETSESWETPTPFHVTQHWSDRFMGWYADKLLQPFTQAIVLVCFFALFVGSIFGVLSLEQRFDMNDLVPYDSYMRGFASSLRLYSDSRNGMHSYAFFRDIDQSDPVIQQQMFQFVDELVDSGAIASMPSNFWLRDFLQFANQTGMAVQTGLPFSRQVDTFLKEPLYNNLYDDHIDFDLNGQINASRCEIYIPVDISDAQGGIAAFRLLRNVSGSQPINQGIDGEDWKMFTFQDWYHLWEFYLRVLNELSSSTIIGVIAVSLVGLLLIPHWSAVFYVAPMIVCLYVDMLGYISYTNVNVNAISYVQLVMSIGLMVDFIMHILMRYYECQGTRRERVKQTLQTMGSSIFVGGLSSLLGVSLLAFSTAKVLQLVFVAVLGLVVFGILHGLVFLPVILSLIGPE